MRDARSGPSSAACPASAKSATHSYSRGRMSGRHKNFVASFQSSVERPRFVSSTSRAPRYTSQHTSNASSAVTGIAPPPVLRSSLLRRCFNASTNRRLHHEVLAISPDRRSPPGPANPPLQLIFPDVGDLRAADNLAHPEPLLHHETSE